MRDLTRATYGCCHAPVVGGVDPQHKCNMGRGESAATVRRGALAATAMAAPARHAPSKPHGRAAEDAMADQLALSGHNVLTWGEWLLWRIHGLASESSVVVREARWGQALTPERRFRADFLLPAHLLMLEIEGGAHGVQRQRKHDVLRAQLAEQAGYRILRVLPEQIATGEALALVRAAIKGGA